MKFDPEIYHRRSIRLKGYDYSQAGAYFVTIVAWQREMLFGEIVDGESVLNELGEIVREEWERTAVVRPNVELGEYVVMPNHFHGILVFHENVGATLLPSGVLREGRPYEDHIAIRFIGRGDGAIQIHCHKTDQWIAECDGASDLAAELWSLP